MLAAPGKEPVCLHVPEISYERSRCHCMSHPGHHLLVLPFKLILGPLLDLAEGSDSLYRRQPLCLLSLSQRFLHPQSNRVPGGLFVRFGTLDILFGRRGRWFKFYLNLVTHLLLSIIGAVSVDLYLFHPIDEGRDEFWIISLFFKK